MARASVPAVRRALLAAGLDLDFERDPSGYHYFIYDDRGPTYETRSIMVCYTSRLSVAQWVERGREALAEIIAKLQQES